MIRAIINPEPQTDAFKDESAKSIDQLAGQQKRLLVDLREALNLNDQEKIMLRMIYVEGLSKSATSKALGLPAHHAGRIVNEALQRIGTALNQCGLDLESLIGAT